jgi:hypothetical protein
LTTLFYRIPFRPKNGLLKKVLFHLVGGKYFFLGITVSGGFVFWREFYFEDGISILRGLRRFSQVSLGVASG